MYGILLLYLGWCSYTWNCEISYKNGYVGLLVLQLLLRLNPWLTVEK